MRTNLDPTTSLPGDRNPDVSSEHLTVPNKPAHRVVTDIEQEDLDDLAEMLDMLETSYTRLKTLGTQLDNMLTAVPKGTSALETYNRELEKINAELNTKYKTAQEMLFELKAENRALKQAYKRLEAIVIESCDRISSLAAGTPVQTAEDIWWNEDEIVEAWAPVHDSKVIYADSWNRNEDVEARTPIQKAEEVCAESWNRNKIVAARVPVQRLNADANPDTKANAHNIPYRDKFGTRSLELCCDCGVTFKVAGGKLNSIKVKHNPEKPGSGRAKLSKTTTTTTEARDDDDASSSPQGVMRLRSGSSHIRPSDMEPFLICMVLLFIPVVCILMCFWALVLVET